ncbi:unnamed protein product [Brassicogethes aeneus]|uniref:Uncharacterized protein n=1 Tax=Brassicogethes aeneus TaxID=1431903 RepID=A0A9P0B4S6_BRAAE|nr:unnamed protein product [Brassicogethes aeneus]
MLVFILSAVLLVAFFLFIFNKLTLGISDSAVCLVGKTAIVTGGNAGIGYHIVRILASRGCRIIIADRDNSDKTREKLINETKNPNIISKHLDLASFESIRKFAEEFNNCEERLDILINNAGVGKSFTDKTVDGFNDVVQINHLGPFLLTHLLMDKLKKCAPSRIVNTSSSLAFTNNLTKENFLTHQNFEYWIIPFNMMTNYSNTKLEVLMTSNIMAGKLKGTGVTCNAVHPGIARTDLIQKSMPTNYFALWWTIGYNLITAKNPWEAAQNTVHVATAHELENVTGKYFWDCKVFPFLPKPAQNMEFSRWVYEESEKLVKLKESEKL